MRSGPLLSQPSAALVLVMMGGGANVLRYIVQWLLSLAGIDVEWGPLWDPEQFQ